MANVRRLHVGDEALAAEMFRVMAAVFAEDDDNDETGEALRDDDVAALMRRSDFWAIAAIEGDAVIGGLTAHALPMTRDRSTELFIYDLAVKPEWQRRGIGRAIVAELLARAHDAGIGTAFVPADNEDTHALDFYRAIGGTPSPVTFFTLSTKRAK